MSTNSTSSPAQETDSTSSQAQKTNWFASFSDLIPVLLLVILVLFHLWALSIIFAIASALLTMAIGVWWQKRRPGSLEILSIVFALINCVLYFGFNNLFLLRHLGVFIYAILLTQVVISLVRNQPWTEQYARRSVPEAVWQLPAFHAANYFISVVWGSVFAIDVILSFLSNIWIGTVLPLVLLILTACLTPVLTKWYATRAARAAANS